MSISYPRREAKDRDMSAQPGVNLPILDLHVSHADFARWCGLSFRKSDLALIEVRLHEGKLPQPSAGVLSLLQASS